MLPTLASMEFSWLETKLPSIFKHQDTSAAADKHLPGLSLGENTKSACDDIFINRLSDCEQRQAATLSTDLIKRDEKAFERDLQAMPKNNTASFLRVIDNVPHSAADVGIIVKPEMANGHFNGMVDVSHTGGNIVESFNTNPHAGGPTLRNNQGRQLYGDEAKIFTTITQPVHTHRFES